MTFRDQRLDPAISFGAQGGPTFQTVIAVQESGDESREATRSADLGVWDVSYAARLPAVWRPLQAHFLVMGGRRDTWPFKDWTDFECSTAQGVLVALSSTTWQIYKRYTVGSLTYDKKLVLPVTGTIVVVGTGSYTVGRTTGIITKSSGAAPTGVSCQFDKLCRFDTDQMKALTIDRAGADLIVGWSGIPIKEVPA